MLLSQENHKGALVTTLENETLIPQKQIIRSGHDKNIYYQYKIWFIRIVFVVVIIGAWQIAGSTHLVNPLFTGEPSQIARSFPHVLNATFLKQDLLLTIEEVLSSYIIGCIIGVIAGLILVTLPIIQNALAPLMTGINSIPRVALVPVFITWFGLGLVSRAALGLTLVVFVMLSSTVAGFSQANRDLKLLARSLGATRRQWFLKFLFPNAVPTLAAGLEVGLSMAFLGVVAAELVGGANGVGAVLSSDANAFQMNDYFAVLIVLAIISLVFAILIRIVTQKLTKWRIAENR